MEKLILIYEQIHRHNHVSFLISGFFRFLLLMFTGISSLGMFYYRIDVNRLQSFQSYWEQYGVSQL